MSYSFVDGDQYGTPLFWVCRARHDIAALQGSQYGLIQSQPWDPALPGTFPSQFVDYAGAVLGGGSPFALLGHHDGERY